MSDLFKKILFLSLLFAFSNARAKENRYTYLKISYANDLFTGTDRYFTQGIRIELISPAFRYSPVSYLHFLPRKFAVLYHSLAIQQDGFTPTSIQRDTILRDDRPYCGSIFLTNSLYAYSATAKAIFHTQLDLGAIGPLALGYEEQTAIHKAINNVQPRGWKNEIRNDLIINYKVGVHKSIYDSRLFDLSAIPEIRVGTMFTDIAAGAHARLGLKEKWYMTMESGNTQKFQLFAFAKGNLKAVGYNATLQGGLINRSSPHTIKGSEISRMVGKAEFGLVASYRKLQIEYSQTYISREFKKGLPHAWGNIAVMLGF